MSEQPWRSLSGVITRVVSRLLLFFTRPFDEPYYRDPLFRGGLAASCVSMWSVFVMALALGKVDSSFGAAGLVVLGPLWLNLWIFGVVGCSIRAFRREWSGHTRSGAPQA